MGTITLPNFRVSGTDRARVRLKDGGVYVEWSTMTDIKAWLYSVEQKAISGRFDVRVDPQDGTRLLCVYSAQKPQYLGVNKIILQCKYDGAEKAYDKPLWNFVRWTDDQAGEEVTIDDPEVDVEIVAEDMSSSILDEATAAALAAAAHAEHAASLVPLQVLQDCEAATGRANAAKDAANAAAEHATPYIGENGHWWRWDNTTGAYVDTGEVAQGPTGNGIQSVEQTQTSQESEGENVVTVTMTNGTQAQFTIRNGKQGEQGIQGVPGVANAKYKQVDTLPTAGADTMDFIYLTPTQTAGVYDMSYTEQDGNTYTWKPLGTTAIQLADYASKEEVSQLEAKVDGVSRVETASFDITAGEGNTYNTGDYAAIDLPAGTYNLTFDDTIVKPGTQLWVKYAGNDTWVFIDQIGNLSTITFQDDVTTVGIWAVAANSLKTATLVLTFTDTVSQPGLIEKVADLEDAVEDLEDVVEGLPDLSETVSGLVSTVSALEVEVTTNEYEVNGKDNSASTTIPITGGVANTYSAGAAAEVVLKKGTYNFEWDTAYLGSQADLYVCYVGSTDYSHIGKFSASAQFTIENDVWKIGIWAVAAQCLATGDCSFVFTDATKVVGVVPRIEELNLEITGKDNSTTVSHTITEGSSANGRESADIKKGSYRVIEESNPLTGVTVYFENASQTTIVSGTLNTFITNGLTLTEDCKYVRYYKSGTPSVSGVIKLVFKDTNPVPGIIPDIESLENKIFDGDLDVYLVQGAYYNGSPNSSTTGVRFDRMFADTELPIKISVPEITPAIVFRIYRYSTAGDYTSFIDQANLQGQYNKEIVLDKSWLKGAKGLALSFAYEGDETHELTPAMMTGVKWGIYTVENRLDDIMPPGPIYFGEPIALGIKDKTNTMSTEVIIEHTPTSYVYTRYNQSMAIYNGKAFCFNDTHTTDDTFCVVIDVDNKTVLSRVTSIPSFVDGSHLNNATFTNVFYEQGDAFPLLLLSRGDYADRTANDQEMYIVRITEGYTFTLIKTIKTSGTYYFNPSWDYDAERGMIWGHLHKHGDWRWEFGENYRKFNGNGLFFQAFADTQYICIVSDEEAATDADITITVGMSQSAQTRTIAIASGSTINPADTVMPYVLTEGGYSYITVNQSAGAFTGKYIVCSCDANGDNRIPINYQSVIRGFPAPNLRDGETITITDSDMTPEVVIDAGIFQGGCAFGGKLVLPFGGFSTINGQPTSFMSSQNTIIVDPTSGTILSVIPTGKMENEGCAIYNGKLYISSHNANAGANEPSFNIVAYSF